MSLVRNGNGNGNSNQTTRYRDPFAMARDLLSWDPLFTGRPASAFAPAFEVSFAYCAPAITFAMPGRISAGSTKPSVMPWRMLATFSRK